MPSAMDDQTHMGQLVFKYLSTDPEEICQIDGQTGETETRGSMRNRAVKCAIHMTKLGLKIGDMVMVCTDNDNNTFLPLVGSLMTGVTHTAVDIKMSKFEHLHMLKILRPNMIFCTDSHIAEFEDNIKLANLDIEIVVLDKTSNKTHRHIREFYENDYDTKLFQPASFDTSKTLALIICSSGTSGLPKGACHTHKGLSKHVLNLRPAFQHLRMIQYSSNHWVTGVIMALFCLTIPSQKINSLPYSADRFYDYLEKYKYEMLALTPAGLRLVIKHPKFETADMSSIKIIMIAGASVDYSDVKIMRDRTNAKVMDSYGMSEAGGPIAFAPRDVPLKFGSIGKCTPYVNMKLIDVETKEEIKEPHRLGELYLKSDYFMTGYYNDPINTAKSINSEGWLMTGDLAKLDEDGFIFIMDRIKEVIKSRGHSIHPAHLEEVINSLPGVLESVIVGIDHKEMNQIPVAFVNRKKGGNVTALEIKNAVSENFGYYCHLDEGGVVFVDSLPMTPSGKFKKNDLRELYKTAEVE